MNSIEKYLQPLLQAFEKARDPETALGQENYMRNQFPFYGIKMVPVRKITMDFLKEHGAPSSEKEIYAVIHHLFQLPERENQFAALEMMLKWEKKAPIERMKLYESLIITKSWWDTVDALAARLAGLLLLRHPELMGKFPDKWIKSKNKWLRRSAIICQLKHKGKTDFMRLEHYVRLCAHEEDFFIRKAIGWALREYSNTNPNWVKKLVKSVQLSELSEYEALRLMK